MTPLLRGGWIVKHLFALLIFGTFIGLGFWQLDRLGQRRAANAARLALLDQSAVTFSDTVDPLSLVGRKLLITGRFLNEQSVILRGRKSDSGVDGVHLLTPLQISGSNKALIVDRGWLPAAQALPERRAAFAIEREVTIEGLAQPAQSRPDTPLAPMDLPLPGETRIDAWVRVDIGKLQAQIPTPLLPIFIEQLPAPNTSASLPRPSDPRLLDEGPHLSYAIQWFAFAAILVVVYAALIRQELRRA